MEHEPDFARTLGASYADLRAIAASYLRRERRGHTLGPTALVHEGVLKLFPGGWAPELPAPDFLKRVARAMRLVLVDHARRRNAVKRAPGRQRALDDSMLLYERCAVDILELSEAMDRLEAIDGDLALLVELRFFAGLTEPEIALELGVSLSTVARMWRFARLWLARELGGGD